MWTCSGAIFLGFTYLARSCSDLYWLRHQHFTAMPARAVATQTSLVTPGERKHKHAKTSAQWGLDGDAVHVPCVQGCGGIGKLCLASEVASVCSAEFSVSYGTLSLNQRFRSDTFAEEDLSHNIRADSFCAESPDASPRQCLLALLGLACVQPYHAAFSLGFL